MNYDSVYDPYGLGLYETDVAFLGLGKAAKKIARRAKKIGKGIGKAAKKVAKVAAPVLDQAAPFAQQALKATGPWGNVASGAIGATRAIAKGKKLENVLWAAAEGAAPQGMDRAISAARQVRHGNFGGAAMTALSSTPAAKFGRGLTAADPLSKAFPVVSRGLKLGNLNVALARQALARNPQLTALAPAALGRSLGISSRIAGDALRNTRHVLPFRSLSRSATGIVRRYQPLAAMRALRSDTAGLEEGGTIYVVEQGDSPWKITKALIGDGNRYRELLKSNPQYPKTTDGSNFKSFWAGMRLNVPSAWLSIINKPSVAPTSQTEAPQAVVQAKAILATWGQTDGRNQAGLTDYGLNALDLSTDWAARDRMMLTSFSNWSNARNATQLATDGTLTAAHVAALRAWVESHAAVPVMVPPVQSSPPESTPTPEQEQAPTPVATPAPLPVPVPVQLPIPVSVVLPESPAANLPVPQAPTLPPIVTMPTTQPAQPAPSQATPTTAKKPDDGLAMLALLGAGAALFL